ncbi:MAG: hypothetical protein RBU37_21130 [Myxococcota bacterium]|nr:hypothetical protein [Myxococcota bacterium]
MTQPTNVERELEGTGQVPNGQEAPHRQEDEQLEQELRRIRRRRLLGVVLTLLLVVTAVGVVTTLVGIGPFGIRLAQHGTIKVFVYNGTPHFAHINLDGMQHQIKPFEGKTVSCVGGELSIETELQLVERDEETRQAYKTEQRRFLERREFSASHQNYLYHIAEPSSSCLAIADMSTYYDGDSGGKLRLLGKVFPDSRLQPLDTEEVLYPSEVMPDKTADAVIWLGVVACDVLESDELSIDFLTIMAEQTRKEYEKMRELEREAARIMEEQLKQQ